MYITQYKNGRPIWLFARCGVGRARSFQTDLRNDGKKFNELPRINHCSSCEVHLVNVMNEFCRECPECHRVIEYGDDQFQEVSPGRSAAPSAHLKHSLQKWKTYEMFSFNQISFLGNVVAQFQAKTGKSVNIFLLSAQLF